MASARVTLIATASTAALRAARFPLDEPLDEYGRADAAGLTLPERVATARVSPVLRCRETAECLGLQAVDDSGLAAWDVGDWAGRGLEDVPVNDLQRWREDPDWAGHGGESLSSLIARVGRWLDGLVAGPTVAVADQAVVRAAVAAVIPGAFWSVEVAPLRQVHLRGSDGRWVLLP